MGGATWRRTRTVPVVFLGTALMALLVSAVFLTDVRGTAQAWVFVAALALAGVAALASAAALPIAVSFNDDGIRLRYLHRREGLMWEQVQHLHVIEGSVLLETSHRTIDLGSLGYPVRRDLAATARRRGRTVRADMPEDYVPPPEIPPPNF